MKCSSWVFLQSVQALHNLTSELTCWGIYNWCEYFGPMKMFHSPTLTLYNDGCRVVWQQLLLIAKVFLLWQSVNMFDCDKVSFLIYGEETKYVLQTLLVLNPTKNQTVVTCPLKPQKYTGHVLFILSMQGEGT